MAYRPTIGIPTQTLHSIDGIPDLRRVGKRVAETKVKEDHFVGFIPS